MPNYDVNLPITQGSTFSMNLSELQVRTLENMCRYRLQDNGRHFEDDCGKVIKYVKQLNGWAYCICGQALLKEKTFMRFSSGQYHSTTSPARIVTWRFDTAANFEWYLHGQPTDQVYVLNSQSRIDRFKCWLAYIQF